MYAKSANARGIRHAIAHLLLVATATAWLPACAQTQEPPAPGVAYEPVFSAEEIAELVAPIALYPDDLLAVVLPASSYPLQIVEAQRFLEAAAKDPSLKPHEDWDDSVVALLNYPEVVKLLNDDLDWTQALGQAVLSQQAEVLAAIEGFRKRAYTSGNLRSDDRQVVEVEDDAIRIRPVNPQVIYVPYYEPAVVTVYRTVPAYHYYPRPYPVYYYPYPADYVFASGFFWGVTTFYTLGWHTHHIHVYHYDYDHHPFYGRPYYHHRHYYRRPPHPRYRAAPGYRVNDGSWERHEYPRNRDRQYYDRDGDRSLDGYTAEYRDADRARLPVRDSTETYWQPDYQRTGARPGTDPRRAMYRRGEPQQQRDRSGSAAPPDRRQGTLDPTQDRALQRLERQEQEQARRQIESQERHVREFEQRLQRDEARQLYEQNRSVQNQRTFEQRERAQSQRDYELQRRAQERQRSEQTQRPFEQQQRSRQQQGERDQRQYEQQRERGQQHYEQGARQQQHRRDEQEFRERTQQPNQSQQFAPQSRSQRPAVPQHRSSPEVRTQPRMTEAPRNYRGDSGAQRMERTARTVRPAEQRQVEQRTTERAGQRGDRANGRSNGSKSNEGNGAESRGPSLGREANGRWARN